MSELADLNVVKAQIDPYLAKTLKLKSYDPESGNMANTERPVITDDGKLPPNDPLMTNSQSRTALLIGGVQGNPNSEHYWSEYGRLVHEKFQKDEPMGIRCDTCTALAFYLLKGNVSGSITVIEQNQGKANGHWFLLVGCPKETDIKYPNEFPRGCFVVDLWGVGVLAQRKTRPGETSLVFPPKCIYDCGAGNTLTKKIYVEGITTLPTKEQFVRETTVPGLIADKSRSGELQALDRALDNFHKRSGDINAVNTALQAWIGAKSKRHQGPQGEVIESIRNKDKYMESLRTQVQWLSGSDNP